MSQWTQKNSYSTFDKDPAGNIPLALKAWAQQTAFLQIEKEFKKNPATSGQSTSNAALVAHHMVMGSSQAEERGIPISDHCSPTTGIQKYTAVRLTGSKSCKSLQNSQGTYSWPIHFKEEWFPQWVMTQHFGNCYANISKVLLPETLHCKVIYK